MAQRPTSPTEESQWNAIVMRNWAAGSAFHDAVGTTGVFSLSGCSSHPPKRENVEFCNTRQEGVGDSGVPYHSARGHVQSSSPRGDGGEMALAFA